MNFLYHRVWINEDKTCFQPFSNLEADMSGQRNYIEHLETTLSHSTKYSNDFRKFTVGVSIEREMKKRGLLEDIMLCSSVG